MPTYEGAESLTVSHTDVDGDYTYVFFNTVEDGCFGALDIIRISDPTDPRVTSSFYYTNAGINSIDYDIGYVYLVGGVDAERLVIATANSFVAKIVALNGRLVLNAGITYGFQKRYKATDDAVEKNNVIATSGQEGFVGV